MSIRHDDVEYPGGQRRAGTVVVVGGGTMGAGIAQVMLNAVERVVIVESNDEAARRAVTTLEDGMTRQFRRAEDPAAEVEAATSRVEVQVGLDSSPGLAPLLVIEAVPESLDMKREVLAAIEGAFPETPLLATNTSSLSISELADGLSRPNRFVGMHFFNPVPLSLLTEVVVGDRTSPQTVEAARSWVEALRMEAIVVRDSPGFATSRLGLALGLEAIRMVETDVATVEDIDRGMVLGYKHPVGPLRLTDLVGLDVRLGIAEHLAVTIGPRFEPPDLLRRMVGEGNLGKKSGRGFYTWG